MLVLRRRGILVEYAVLYARIRSLFAGREFVVAGTRPLERLRKAAYGYAFDGFGRRTCMKQTKKQLLFEILRFLLVFSALS